MYKIIRSILFMFDAEKVHHFSMNGLRLLCRVKFIKNIIANQYKGIGNWELGNQRTTLPIPNSQFPILNLPFKNPIGLAAGFDKNAKYLNELEALGFGFVEIGTVTPLPQDGNPTPRLFRLPKDKALINRMGFNNEGVEVVVERLRSWQFAKRQRLAKKSSQIENHLPTAHCPLIIGGNIGKNKITPNENAWKDYEICFNALHDYVDYFVVNVSSPNTPGLRELQEKEPLKKILTHLQNLNKNFAQQKPILLKIAPDLTQTQIDDVIDLSKEINLDGLVVANTSIDRTKLVTNNAELETIGAGGLSGLPVKERATEMVKYISEKTNGQIPIIASGGIFTGADAEEKLQAGASLVQVWTGFVYEGPAIVKKITTYLAANKIRY
jgi:dihydroorotate dehydrogenase